MSGSLLIFERAGVGEFTAPGSSYGWGSGWGSMAWGSQVGLYSDQPAATRRPKARLREFILLDQSPLPCALRVNGAAVNLNGILSLTLRVKSRAGTIVAESLVALANIVDSLAGQFVIDADPLWTTTARHAWAEIVAEWANGTTLTYGTGLVHWRVADNLEVI
jgi:hypothetical protein